MLFGNLARKNGIEYLAGFGYGQIFLISQFVKNGG
jgi:hypothetical protein